ncbi:hypothetical protein ElyMa_004311200 [Elysia marginata]|uniref:Uncharacterized protein n=1 Tax=Elysia marginata TaxID=1093978 RepID=A0AAV4H075_9GAST|nr:hypothetical protein ElyMa_004311200 [Elysia marginata]
MSKFLTKQDTSSLPITALSLPGRATSPGTGRNPKRSQGLVVRLGQGRTLDIMRLYISMLWVWCAPPIGTPESLADCALGGKLSRWHTLRAEPPQRYQRIGTS